MHVYQGLGCLGLLGFGGNTARTYKCTWNKRLLAALHPCALKRGTEGMAVGLAAEVLLNCLRRVQAFRVMSPIGVPLCLPHKQPLDLHHPHIR